MSRVFAALWKLLLAAAVLAAVLLIYLDAVVSTTFHERKWERPAKVYARPLELYPDKRLTGDEVERELRLLGYAPARRLTAPGQFARGGNVLEFFSRAFDFADESVAATRVRLSFAGGRVRAIHSGGVEMPLFRLEPVQIGGIYPRHREDRLLVRLGEVPPTMLEGLLAVEDRGFFQHWGLSPRGIARALLANLRAGRVVEGGSTLTQQLVKNYYLDNERSVWRKLREALMAMLLELHYSKEGILEAYVNEVFLAQDGPRAIHGFALASRFFFDRDLAELGLHQQALLVGMITGPSLYSPLRNPRRARERRDAVLEIMRGRGVIGDVEAQVARAMPLDLSQRPRVMNSYPAFLDLVRRQLGRDYHQEDLGSLGLGIFTSFDPLLQRQAERSIARVMERLDPERQLETALVVTSYESGEVRALVGSRRPRFAGFNRALDAVRPVGSLVKPAVYLTALARGGYTLATPLSDTPLELVLENGTTWEPRNFDRQFRGPVLLHQALSQSLNLATARLGVRLGVEPVLATLRDLGVERTPLAVPAVFLGAVPLAPVEAAAMYQTIAAGGYRLPLRAIRDVVDSQGNVLLRRFAVHYERVASQQSMHLLHYALREVVREGTGKSVYSHLPRSFAVAGKTGTSNDNRDSWFAGFSGDLMAVCWVGRDDNGETALTGATGALRIWGDFMARASRRELAYRVPERVEHHWVDETSGLLSRENCQGARLMPFLAGTRPPRDGSVCLPRRPGAGGWFRELF